MISEQKRRILDVARDLFCRFGFAKTTLDDIAEGVGIKKGSLYYYFESKDVLFSSVVAELADSIGEQIRAAASGANSARDSVMRFTRACLTHTRELFLVYGITPRVAVELKPLADEMLSGFTQGLTDYLAGILDSGVKSGEFRPCDTARVSAAIQKTLEGLNWTMLLTSKAIESADLGGTIRDVQNIVGLVLDGIASQPSLSTTSETN